MLYLHLIALSEKSNKGKYIHLYNLNPIQICKWDGKNIFYRLLMRAIYHYTHAFYTYISLLMNARRRQLLHKRKLNWKHMCCPVQEFRMVWEVGGGCRVLLWMRVLVMGERKTQEGKKICLWGVGAKAWRLGGHENINSDVSEAIYSSLGIQCGGGVGGLVWVGSI